MVVVGVLYSNCECSPSPTHNFTKSPKTCCQSIKIHTVDDSTTNAVFSYSLCEMLLGSRQESCEFTRVQQITCTRCINASEVPMEAT